MKNSFVKIGALLFVLILTLSVFAACGDKKDDKPVTTGTGAVGSQFDPENIPELPEGVGQSDIDKFYEEQYAKMSPEDIAQFEQDLVDLGITKEEFYRLMYAGGANTTTKAPAVTTAASVTSATTAAK